jgi:hypothetical protein
LKDGCVLISSFEVSNDFLDTWNESLNVSNALLHITNLWLVDKKKVLSGGKTKKGSNSK